MSNSKCIYVAASFEQRIEVRKLYELLEGLGHKITNDWTAHKEIADAPTIEARTKLSRQYAIEDVNGVRDAQVFILLLNERKSTGAHIELGIALGCKSVKSILIVTKHGSSQLFYEHPKVKQVKDISEALLVIEKI